MRTGRTLILVSSLCALILAYWLYEPAPDYVKDRFGLAILTSTMRISMALGDALEYFHLGTFESLSRNLIGLVVPGPKNTKSVAFTYHLFANSRTLVAIRPMKQSGGAVIFIHGGGWAIGAPEMHAQLYAELVEKTGVTIFAVRYRLAPDHKFPSAFDDCLAATEAIFASLVSFGVDPARVAVAGDSAGGQLAASVVQALSRRNSQFKPKLQVLIFPATQIVNLNTNSYTSRQDAPIMNIILPRGYLSLYLTGSRFASPWLSSHGHVTDQVKAAYEEATGETVPSLARSPPAGLVNESVASQLVSLATDYRISPLLGKDLDKLDLPPAHILACEFDPLFDDSVLYARRLERSGVRALLRVFRTYHGSLGMPRDGWEIRDYLGHVCRDLL